MWPFSNRCLRRCAAVGETGSFFNPAPAPGFFHSIVGARSEAKGAGGATTRSGRVHGSSQTGLREFHMHTDKILLFTPVLGNLADSF